MSLSEVNYQLLNKLSYTHAQEGACEGTFISMKAPSVRHLSHVAPMKQSFMSAVAESSAKVSGSVDTPDKDKDDSDSMDGSAIIGILEASSVDMNKYVKSFSKMIIHTNLFQIEGETKFTETLLDNLSVEDFYGLMGDYMLNFILASLIKKMNEN